MIDGGYHFAALKGTTFMDPQVIADTALYLNSDLAAKVTGVTIPVDAGHLHPYAVQPRPGPLAANLRLRLGQPSTPGRRS